MGSLWFCLELHIEKLINHVNRLLYIISIASSCGREIGGRATPCMSNLTHEDVFINWFEYLLQSSTGTQYIFLVYKIRITNYHDLRLLLKAVQLC